ncbi:Helix-turn-helix domain-containing protein [Thermomonospora echinospora]|uniref:Helix-turn-helix domain-containing protein n=1 Tax=Thermomonospora echinospora TaxID=1992 RepID=A0A1H5VZA6_9ACTN|nr:helix-turn-helix domain-containing protein [Thermomonospora echinospora]SEF92358.1 Helix-turn-helix domain-containing protein [Thermomonospora echinospora]
MTADDDEYMTVTEFLAKIGGVSRRTFYRWRELGIAPVCHQLPNRELLIRRDDFRTWMESLREDAA